MKPGIRRRFTGNTGRFHVPSIAVVVLKPSKYMEDGYVERFRWGFMPNSTVPYVRSMTPDVVGDTPIEVHAVDEYVHTDLRVFLSC